VFLGDAASKSNLMALHGPLVLHVATHGFFLNNNALEIQEPLLRGQSMTWMTSLGAGDPLMRAGLALAGANNIVVGANTVGVSSAREIAEIDLQGTQLVVLSACDTGNGQVRSGEGIYGMRRAFALAGTRSQLVTLWKIPDEITSELVVDYYKRLLSGEGRAVALTGTERDWIAAHPNLRHPYYWAAFQLVGDWTPIRDLSDASRIP
jgi:CHAT domain-containing protein